MFLIIVFTAVAVAMHLSGGSFKSDRKHRHTYLMALIKAEQGRGITARREADAYAAEWLDGEGIAEVYGAMAYAYLTGRDGHFAIDRIKGLQWMRLAADAGNKDAQRVLLQYHADRSNLLPPQTLLKYTLSLAESGDSHAQAYAASLYMQGQGIPRDMSRAFHWAQQSAAQKNHEGMELLRRLHQSGATAQSSKAEAHKLTRELREAGVALDRSMGSAFSPSPGMFVTNHHVVEGCKKLYGIHGNTHFPLSVVTVTADQDLALLRSGDRRAAVVGTLPVAPDYVMERGEQVYAAGYSGGSLAMKAATVLSPHERRELTLNSGSGTRTITYDFILFTGSVDHGDSGGPIVDTTGKVIAVTNAGVTRMNGKEREKVAGMGVVLGELRALIAPHLTAYALKDFDKPEKLSGTNRQRLLEATIQVVCKA